MGTRAVDKGPTADRVAANVRELRAERRITLDDLAARMKQIGRPILKSGLSKIESGDRRVDVDDLMALALALDVSPSRLLLTGTATSESELMLTPEVQASESTAWEWASGEKMPPADLWAKDPGAALNIRRLRQWREENRPHDRSHGVTVEEFFAREESIRPIAIMVDEVSEREGWSYETTLDLAKTALAILALGKTAKDNG